MNVPRVCFPGDLTPARRHDASTLRIEHRKGQILDAATFCTLLGKQTIPPHAQRRLMRHRDLATTLRYTHLDTEDLMPGVKA